MIQLVYGKTDKLLVHDNKGHYSGDQMMCLFIFTYQATMLKTLLDSESLDFYFLDSLQTIIPFSLTFYFFRQIQRLDWATASLG